MSNAPAAERRGLPAPGLRQDYARAHPRERVKAIPRVVTAELRRAAPYAVVLALALGGIVVAGANLATAFPSEERPFGWSGAASFDGAVATVRSDLALAASIPALLLGARALAGREPTATPARQLLAPFALHAALLLAAAFVAGGIGAWGAKRTPMESYWAFSVAHGLLALSAYSVGFLWAGLMRRHALAYAAATWLFFLGVYDALVNVTLFRQVGYHRLVAGDFPTWFYASQALSPLSTYRGTLILWQRGFMDFMEKAALGNAVLPAWVNPGLFVALTLVLWVALPVGLGLLAWRMRGRARAPAPRRAPEKAG